jgi:hypothetical protein
MRTLQSQRRCALPTREKLLIGSSEVGPAPRRATGSERFDLIVQLVWIYALHYNWRQHARGAQGRRGWALLRPREPEDHFDERAVRQPHERASAEPVVPPHRERQIPLCAIAVWHVRQGQRPGVLEEVRRAKRPCCRVPCDELAAIPRGDERSAVFGEGDCSHRR